MRAGRKTFGIRERKCIVAQRPPPFGQHMDTFDASSVCNSERGTEKDKNKIPMPFQPCVSSRVYRSCLFSCNCAIGDLSRTNLICELTMATEKFDEFCNTRALQVDAKKQPFTLKRINEVCVLCN